MKPIYVLIGTLVIAGTVVISSMAYTVDQTEQVFIDRKSVV